MAVLTPTTVSRAGVADATQAAAAGGDLLPNTGKEWVEFVNTGGGAITVTVNGYADGVAVAVRTFVVPATTGRMKAGPFPPSEYNNASNQVSFTYSGVTSLAVGAYTT